MQDRVESADSLSDSNAASVRISDERVPTDERLLAQAAHGDADALEALYDRYAAAVMGLALKIIGDRAAAEEIVQETFWRVWRGADTFQAQRGSFAGWLFGIARNLTIDVCRRRKVRPRPAISEEEEQRIERQADPDVDVAQAAWAAIKHRQVRAAMSDLPQAQRRVIELAYFGGMTRQEIAQVTGEALGTIHTRARLALQKLRETLLAQGFDD
jgi:RNA polymerase sigma-70 factor (ECF subfamily)